MDTTNHIENGGSPGRLRCNLCSVEFADYEEPAHEASQRHRELRDRAARDGNGGGHVWIGAGTRVEAHPGGTLISIGGSGFDLALYLDSDDALERLRKAVVKAQSIRAKAAEKREAAS
jgi:hypothetical protein